MITDKDTLRQLARQNYDALFAGRAGSPEFPPEEELSACGYDFAEWVEANHEMGLDVINRIARAFRIPFYPVTQSHPTAGATELIGNWAQSIAIAPKSTRPWLPLNSMGPYLMIGHFSPASDDYAGLPEKLCLRVLITKEDYDKCLEDGLSRLNKPAPVNPIEAVGDLSIFTLLTEIKIRYKKDTDRATVMAAYEADPLVARVEDLRSLLIAYFPHDAILMDDATTAALPREISIREPAVCYAAVGGTLYVLTPRPGEIYKIQDELNQESQDDSIANVRLVGVYAEESAVRAIIERDNRGLSDLTVGATEHVASGGDKPMILDPVRLSQVTSTQLVTDNNANLYVEWMFYKAIMLQSSDVHIERTDKEARVRFRINGSLTEIAFITLDMLPKVLNVLKIYCKMPVVEKRKVMDGSFAIVIGGRRLDARVSMIPHFTEMTCVVRVNSRGMEKVNIDSLDLNPRNRAILLESSSVRTGIVFITGPTGSGKTTTLYALLNHLNTPDRNIVTLEEPIEYQIPGIKQFQINRPAGLDYAAFFKGILRHDPNVILIGEIRDEETAHQAVVAAHTGHLVFATLHTNNAVGVIPRMIGLGVEASELADALVCVQAQRLVRVLCPQCSKAHPITKEERAIFARHMTPPETIRTAHKGGCRVCNSTGFITRRAIMETMPAFPEFIDGIIAGATTSELIRSQRANGFRDLFDEGLAMVAEGLTTMEEAGGWKRAFSDFDGRAFALPGQSGGPAAI